MNYQLITNDAELKSLCEQAITQSYITIDTEFVRIRTFYPHLGLIQIYDGKTAALVDPLTISDWQPLVELLTHPDVIKYLHAGSEDLEVFIHSLNCVPHPLIDTQVLAAFIGHPLSCGFAKLVETYLNIELDKSESRTDWLARPLTEKQCEYAAADVFYLYPLAKILMDKVKEAGYEDAALNECQMLIKRRQQVLLPENAYKEIGQAWQLRPQQLACLQQLAAWRLEQARKRDMAVNFVVREENIWKVARYLPSSLGELDALGLSGQEIRCHGKLLLKIVDDTKELPDDQCPEPLKNLLEHPHYRQAFKAIKALVAEVSEGEKFIPELLASRRQINQYLNTVWEIKTPRCEPEIISGWRKALLETKLTELLQTFS